MESNYNNHGEGLAWISESKIGVAVVVQIVAEGVVLYADIFWNTNVVGNNKSNHSDQWNTIRQKLLVGWIIIGIQGTKSKKNMSYERRANWDVTFSICLLTSKIYKMRNNFFSYAQLKSIFSNWIEDDRGTLILEHIEIGNI